MEANINSFIISCVSQIKMNSLLLSFKTIYNPFLSIFLEHFSETQNFLEENALKIRLEIKVTDILVNKKR